MRYLFLLIALVVIASLMHLYFTSSFSMFSGNNPAGSIQTVEPQLKRMNTNIDRYNKTFESVQEEADERMR